MEMILHDLNISRGGKRQFIKFNGTPQEGVEFLQGLVKSKVLIVEEESIEPTRGQLVDEIKSNEDKFKDCYWEAYNNPNTLVQVTENINLKFTYDIIESTYGRHKSMRLLLNDEILPCNEVDYHYEGEYTTMYNLFKAKGRISPYGVTINLI